MRKLFLMFLIVVFCSLTACGSIPQKRESVVAEAQARKFEPSADGKVHVAFFGPDRSTKEVEKFTIELYGKTNGLAKYIMHDKEADSFGEFVFTSLMRKNPGNFFGESVLVNEMKGIMLVHGAKGLVIDVYGTDMAVEMVNALESIYEAKLPAGVLKATTISFHETDFKKARAAKLLSSLK